jgi:hypothetical protein
MRKFATHQPYLKHGNDKGLSGIECRLPGLQAHQPFVVATDVRNEGAFQGIQRLGARLYSTAAFGKRASPQRTFVAFEHGLPKISSKSNLRSSGVRSATRGFRNIERRTAPNQQHIEPS